MKSTFAILLLCCLCARTNASWFDAVIVGTNPNTVSRRDSNQLVKAICRRQLKKGMVPTACYQLVNKLPTFDREALLKVLDAKCNSTNLEFISTADLASMAEKSLSPTCRQKISHALDIRHYQQEEVDPSNWPDT